MTDRKIKFITFGVLFIFVFIIGTYFRFLHLKVNTIEYIVASNAIIDRNFIGSWRPQEDQFYPKRKGSLKLCNPGKYEKWFENVDYEKCLMISESQYNRCGFWTFAVICFSFAIPKEYFEDEDFMNRLKESMKAPCKIFNTNDQNDYLKNDKFAAISYDLFKCGFLETTKFLNLYLSVYDNKISELNHGMSPGGRIKKRLYKTFYLDWNRDKFVEIRSESQGQR